MLPEDHLPYMAFLKIPLTLKDGYIQEEKSDVAKALGHRVWVFLLTKGESFAGISNSSVESFWGAIEKCGRDTKLGTYYDDEVARSDSDLLKRLQSELNDFLSDFLTIEEAVMNENAIEIDAEITVDQSNRKIKYSFPFEYVKGWQLREPEIFWL